MYVFVPHVDFTFGSSVGFIVGSQFWLPLLVPLLVPLLAPLLAQLLAPTLGSH